MQIRFILIFFTLLPIFLSAQLEEKFDGMSIEDLSQWSGELTDFIINDEAQLQLNASEKGSTQIYAPIDIKESAEWQISFDLDFAPSASNQLIIYLFADDQDLSESSGYFIEVGESGTNDNLKFYRQVDGSKLLLGEGSMAALGSDPASAKLKVIKAANNVWSVFAAYGNDPFVQFDFELVDDEIALGNGFFGLSCRYTETRKDKFFFDDVYVGDIKEDVEAPVLLSTTFIDANQLSLLFNELLAPEGALDPSIFFLDNGIGVPSSINFGEYDNEVILTLDPLAEVGVEYILTIRDIQDLAGNGLTTDITVFLFSVPESGDLVINEILFDPYPDTEDFVELYNISNKYLSLKGLIIQNLDNGRSVMISSDLLIKPLQYLAITSDVDALSEDYQLLIPENVVQHELPAWSNADGNVNLQMNESEQVIDSYDYREDFHSVWIDDTEGVSLERIDPYVDSGLAGNWQSATERSGFATPGYINSNYSETSTDKNEFLLEKKTFSPDGDGFDDFLEVKYRLATTGLVLNMRVFDDRGHLIKTLASNEILGTEGSVIWDGTRDDGTQGKMGIYVIWLEYFDSAGSIAHKKLSCVLAKQLN